MMEKNKYYIQIGTAAVYYKGYVYFSGIQISGLYKMDMETGEVIYICAFEKENNVYQLHSKAYLHGKNIWFIPYTAKYITCVDIETFSMEYYDLPPFTENEEGKKIYGSTYYDSGRIDENRIYLVSPGNDTPLIFDMKKKEIILSYKLPMKKDEIVGYGSAWRNKIWMTPIRGNCIYCADIDGGEMRYIPKVFEENQFSGACVYNDKLWIAPYKSDRLRCYDLKNNIFEDFLFTELYDESKTYREVIQVENKLWILPWAATSILEFDPENKTFFEHFLNKENNDDLHYMSVIETDDNSRVFSEGGYGKIDCFSENGNFKEIKCWMTSQEYILCLKKKFGEKYLWKYSQSAGEVLKEDDLSLELYIEALSLE